ncbi:MAG: gamma-glutamyltransferase family protein [Acidobacteria bacterium]|nr:gamma-glutamyltransferase family protein [Acidobacteriota bacterium]
MNTFGFRSRIASALAVVLLAAPALAQEAAHPIRIGEMRSQDRPVVPGVHGLVTAGHPLATMAGVQTLMKGGNAIDASVAVLAVLNVVRPQMSGAAGNGFLTYFDKASGTVHSLSATGAAPKALRAEDLSPDQLNKGINAGVVPGLFGAWISMLERHGTMSLEEVLGPAIDYAKNGHPMEASVSRAIEASREVFERFPTSVRMFLPEGRVPATGELYKMPDLARTLEKLVEAERAARRGGQNRSEALNAAFDRFYRGDIAEEMARFYEENDGPFTLEDFAAYEPMWKEPLHTNYRGYDVYSSPPTSRGGMEVLMQLNLIEGFDLAGLGQNSAEALHLVIESIKVAKSDVYRYVADQAKFEVPLEGLLSEEYAEQRRALMNERTAIAYPTGGVPPGAAPTDAPPGVLSSSDPAGSRSFAGSTTSFSVVDGAGNAVACTPTHGGMFGTAVVVGGTGLTFNNGTRIGSTAPHPDHPNYARGGQIPILNNSPIIVLKDGELMLALGTPGGETIGQTQFQVLLNILDFGLNIQEAVAAPRLSLFADPNFYTPGSDILVRVENRVTPGVIEALLGMGHRAELTGGYALGSNNGILVDLAAGTMTAGADPRRAAYAVGY